MTRALPFVLAIAAVLVLSPLASAGSQTIIDDRSTLTDPGPVFVGHPASFTGVCPYVDAGRGLPDGGCMKQYTFTVSESDGATADVEITVEYDQGVHLSDDPCVKGADLDLFLYNEEGTVVDKHIGCDSGNLGIIEKGLSAGNYLVEVRGNWGAVVNYRAIGTLFT